MRKEKFLTGKSHTENELYSIQDMITADQKKKALKNTFSDLADLAKIAIFGLVFTIIIFLIGVHFGLFPNT